MQWTRNTCLTATTLAFLCCANVAASGQIVATGAVRTVEFRLTSTLAEVVGENSAHNATEIISPDEPITWDIYVPGNYQPDKPAGLMVYISPTSSGEIPRGGKMASMVATEHAQLFKGAIYNCGVDFWDRHPPRRFELIKQNHYVFVTGTLDQDGSSPEVADLSAWMAQVSANGIGTNLAMFVGHGTLRTLSGTGRAQVPEPGDLERMLAMLETSLQYTFGMSTGLEYNPGLNATSAELQALAEVVGRNDRMIMSHMRNEDDDQLENSIAELLDQGRFAGVHISHLKSVFGKGADRAEQILDILAKARESGIEITADMYPYSASYAGIDLVFPVWAKTLEQFEVAKVERYDELRAYLRDRVNRRNGPDATLLGTDPYTGKTLAALAHELEMPFEDVLIDVIGPDGVSGAYFVMNDELQSRIFADPRGHGTFAKIIEQYVMRDHLVTLAEAVRKMTSFAAGVLGITDRGSVRAGMGERSIGK